MALARMRRGESGMNYWPGFVDALSTLILGIIFLLTVFVVVQFYLQQEVAGKDTALTRLNAQIAELTDLLSMEKAGKATIWRTSWRSCAPRSPPPKATATNIKVPPMPPAPRASAAQGKAPSSPAQLEGEKKLSAKRAGPGRDAQPADRGAAPPARGDRAGARRLREEGQGIAGQIADLGQRLNVALAQKVQELTKYRSDFFGKLREILGNRPDMRIVGDRFVLQSEVFFDTGKADLKPRAAPSSTRWRAR